MRLDPKRALTLASELLTRGVQAIKADSWDVMYEQGASEPVERVWKRHAERFAEDDDDQPVKQQRNDRYHTQAPRHDT